MATKSSKSKYPRRFMQFKVQSSWGKQKCDKCDVPIPVRERYVVVTTEFTYMRGDDEVQTLCRDCTVKSGLPWLEKGQLPSSVEEYQAYRQRKQANGDGTKC